jgi:hypothetical protein
MVDCRRPTSADEAPRVAPDQAIREAAVPPKVISVAARRPRGV